MGLAHKRLKKFNLREWLIFYAYLTYITIGQARLALHKTPCTLKKHLAVTHLKTILNESFHGQIRSNAPLQQPY